MTEPEESAPYDIPMIGPLWDSRIGSDPISWGRRMPRFTYADPETAKYVEGELERLRVESMQILGSELSALVQELQAGENPKTVLHALLYYGESSPTQLAGYLGQLPKEVNATVKSLSFIGVLRQTSTDGFGEFLYTVDENAEVFAA